MNDINRRYLNSWEYNAARILTELEKIIKNNGGAICTTWDHSGKVPEWRTKRNKYIISNRTLSEHIHNLLDQIKILELSHARKEYINKMRDELSKLTCIDNTPIPSHYGDYYYISFALDGHYYYYQLDRNPFFEFIYYKSLIEPHDKINRYCYANKDSKKWLFDCFLSFTCDESDIKEAANLIFNMLMHAKLSQQYHTRDANPHYSKLLYLEEE